MKKNKLLYLVILCFSTLLVSGCNHNNSSNSNGENISTEYNGPTTYQTDDGSHATKIGNDIWYWRRKGVSGANITAYEGSGVDVIMPDYVGENNDFKVVGIDGGFKTSNDFTGKFTFSQYIANTYVINVQEWLSKITELYISAPNLILTKEFSELNPKLETIHITYSGSQECYVLLTGNVWDYKAFNESKGCLKNIYFEEGVENVLVGHGHLAGNNDNYHNTIKYYFADSISKINYICEYISSGKIASGNFEYVTNNSYVINTLSTYKWDFATKVDE